jgi:hypothetical protein
VSKFTDALLTRDLSAVPRACFIPYPEDCLGVYFSMVAFHKHLERTYAFVDIMTYGASLGHARVPVRRAVVGLQNGRTSVDFAVRPEQVKLFTNVHAKMVIGYIPKDDRPEFEAYTPDVYVGSHNHVGTSLYELMVQVSPAQATLLLDYFESFWRTQQNKTSVPKVKD